MTSSQIWKIEKNVNFTNKTDVFLIVQLWQLAILEPIGVQRRNVPDFKGLIKFYLDFEAQGCGSTFTFCHAHLKKAISKTPKSRVSLQGMHKYANKSKEIWKKNLLYVWNGPKV